MIYWLTRDSKKCDGDYCLWESNKKDKSKNKPLFNKEYGYWDFLDHNGKKSILDTHDSFGLMSLINILIKNKVFPKLKYGQIERVNFKNG